MTDDVVGNVEADDGRKEPNVVRIFSDDPDNGPGRELARTAWGLAELYQPPFRALPVFRRDVGAVTSYLLGDQLDDLYAGAREVGANGHRLLSAVLPAPPAAPRPR